MNFKIRQAVLSDLDELNELNKEVQSLHHKIDPAYFKRPGESDIRAELQIMIENDISNVLVAAMNKAFLGFISYRECALPESGLTNATPMLFICHMGVRSLFRKQGIGTALMGAVLNEARIKKIDRIQLDVWTLNFDAKRFFQKHGFQTINEIMVRNP